MHLPDRGCRLGAATTLTILLAVVACGDGTAPEPPEPPEPPQPQATSIEITPASVTLTRIGDTQTFTARVLDQNGATMSVGVTWTSNAPAVFSVSSEGVVTALSNGTGTVQANVETVSGTAGVTVEEVLEVDLSVAAPSVTRDDPTEQETVEVTAWVTNVGNAGTGSAFVARLSADETEVATTEVEPLGPNESVQVAFTAGPFAAGSRQLAIVADPSGAFDDADESDNRVEWSLEVIPQPVLRDGTRTLISGAEGDKVHYVVYTAEGDTPLTVELSGGSGDADLYMHYGERPTKIEDYFCQSTAPATSERCHFNPAHPGPYHVLIEAYEDYSGTTMEVTLNGEVFPYDIEVVFLERGTAAQEAMVHAAVERWESIITADITDITFDEPQSMDCFLVPDIAAGDHVDDMRLYVSLAPMDDDSAWRSHQCWIRVGNYHTILAGLHFNPESLDELAVTEDAVPLLMRALAGLIGHNPFVWKQHGLLGDPSSSRNDGFPGADTHFKGELATQAFDAAGGVGYPGKKVPLTNIGGDSYGVDHLWRESVFGDELLSQDYYLGTDSTTSADKVLSAISIQAFADIGYQVDLRQANSYTLPIAGGLATNARAKATSRRAPFGRAIAMPIAVVDTKGRVVRVVRPIG